MPDDYETYLHNTIRFDWLYTDRDGYAALHWPRTYTPDADAWLALDVTFGCGLTTTAAFIPGVGSRMACPRCPACCDAAGLPRGVGSPKNDPDCRPLVGLDTEPQETP